MTISLVGYLDKRLGQHHGRGPEYKWHCPACIDRRGTESSGPRLHVNVNLRIGHCFRCGYAFRSLESLFRYLNNGALRIEEAKLLNRTSGITRKGPLADVLRALKAGKEDDHESLGAETTPKEMLPMFAAPPHPECASAMRYVAGRGVTRTLLKKHNVHFCAEGDYRGYLVFPITIDHRQVYFTTRYAGRNARRKSKNPVKTPGKHTKATCLLNYDGVVGRKIVAVVEGAFDMMAFDAAVGIMGKEISPEQVSLLEELVPHGLEEVVVALDPDAGLEMEKTFRALQARLPKVSALLLPGGDPWDLRNELTQLMDRRVSELSTNVRVQARIRTGEFIRRRVKPNGFSRASRTQKQVLG